jgi:hypothetical protein
MSSMKRSIIWKISKESLIEIVQKSSSIREILSYFNLDNKGSNYRTLKRRLNEDKIDYSNINLGLNSNKGRRFPNKKATPLSEILIKNSTYTNRNSLKNRLFAAGILKNVCYICGQLPIWNNQPLTLQLDHVNGVANDNRINNLRILCPHCHSQTDTFCGKNIINNVI